MFPAALTAHVKRLVRRFNLVSQPLSARDTRFSARQKPSKQRVQPIPGACQELLPTLQKRDQIFPQLIERRPLDLPSVVFHRQHTARAGETL